MNPYNESNNLIINNSKNEKESHLDITKSKSDIGNLQNKNQFLKFEEKKIESNFLPYVSPNMQEVKTENLSYLDVKSKQEEESKSIFLANHEKLDKFMLHNFMAEVKEIKLQMRNSENLQGNLCKFYQDLDFKINDMYAKLGNENFLSKNNKIKNNLNLNENQIIDNPSDTDKKNSSLKYEIEVLKSNLTQNNNENVIHSLISEIKAEDSPLNKEFEHLINKSIDSKLQSVNNSFQ